MNSMTYYSFLQSYTFKQKILGREVSDSLSVVISHDLKKIITQQCAISWHHYVLSNNFQHFQYLTCTKHTNMHGVDFEPFVSVITLQFQLSSLQAEDLSSWT